MHTHGRPDWTELHDGVELIYHLLDQHDFPAATINGMTHRQVLDLHAKDHPRPVGARR